MMRTIYRQLRIYTAFAGLISKLHLAYSNWFWMQFAIQGISMTIMVFLWRSVYIHRTTINNLSFQQTLDYVILAQLLAGIVENRLIFSLGKMIREGGVATELLRPVDFQGRRYVEELTTLGITLLQKLPLMLIAWVVFGLHWPTNPLIWACFAISVLLGHALLFCFDWIFACIAFYSTETWGLSVMRESFVLFFSGLLIPLPIMPDWLQTLARAMPFAQALYVPISFLSSITPVTEALRVWLIQAFWFFGLLAVSRLVFHRAVRKVTVQGG